MKKGLYFANNKPLPAIIRGGHFPEWHVEAEGSERCPGCGGSRIEVLESSEDGGSIQTQQNHCLNCEATGPVDFC